MAGKKQDEVAKDFFGDDASWFDEDDAASPPAPAPAKTAPVAPTPPVVPEVEPAQTLQSGSAPTMMFSLDQLPDFPLPLEEQAEAGRGQAGGSLAPTEEVLREPSNDLPDELDRAIVEVVAALRVNTLHDIQRRETRRERPANPR